MKTITLPARIVTITTAPGEGYTVTVSGKVVGTFPTYRKARAAERTARKAH